MIQKLLTRFLLLATLLLIPTWIVAQQLPNSGFETFEAGFNGAGSQPVGWKGSNVKKTVIGITVSAPLIFQEANGRTGNCVKIENDAVGAAGITEDAPAYISYGTPWAYISGLNTGSATGGTDGGISFTYCPDTIELWVKRSYSTPENAHALIYLWAGESIGSQYKTKNGGCGGETHRDEESDIRGTNMCSTTQSATLIGVGEWISNQQYSTWTKVQAPIQYYSNVTPQKCNVIISSADYPNGRDATKVHDGAILYADDLRLIYSSQLSEIRIGNHSLANFDPNTYTYSYSLGQGVTTVPQNITCYRNGRLITGSELSINYGALGQPTTITVHAQDGSSTHTYTINFVAQQSTNSRPASIELDGTPLANFNGYVTNYNVTLPYGTTACPNITVTLAEPEQTYTIGNCTGVPGSQTVTVYAEDQSVSSTYTINYTTAALTDNTLQGIKINGVLLADFSPNTTNYVVDLPLGTTTAPTIEAVSAYPQGEQIIVITNNGLYGTSTISVTPAGSSLTRVYRITFRVAASSNAYLNGITIGGTPLANFSPTTTTYAITLPRGTTALPAINWITGDAGQTVTIALGGVNGETRIVVTAQDGSTTVVYRLQFSVTESTNSKLADIKLNGVSLAGFDPDTLNYDVTLPTGTTALPTIAVVRGDTMQNIRILPGGLNGVTTIRVLAENTAYSTTYSIRFRVQQSADAKLADILVGGVSLPGFDPDVMTYTYILPDNATQCPSISAVKSTPGQNVTIVRPNLTGTAQLTVTSETGDSHNVYTINFIYTPSNVCNLTDIQVNGTSIAGFNANTTNYNVNLGANTNTPNVQFTKEDNNSIVTVIANGTTSTDLIVTAADGTTKTYHIDYTVAPSTNALLANIKLYQGVAQGFVALNGFSSNITNYAVQLPWRSTVPYVVNPVPAEDGQTITVNYGGINDTTHIHVVAADGVTTQDYHISYSVVKSNVSTLNDIMIDGVSITTFTSNVFQYNITLPYETTELGTITYEKGRAADGSVVTEQEVRVENNGLNNASTITVTAEDGTTSVYTINVTKDMSSWANANYLDDITVNGLTVVGFDHNTTNYTIEMPYGTTTAPTFGFTKHYAEQQVVVENGGCYGTTRIVVKANIAGVADKVYEIASNVSKVSPASLTSISVDGTPIANFNPLQKTYVVNVTAQPTSVTYTAADGATATSTVNNLKHHAIEVTANNETNTYDVFFFYTNDIIPNMDFEQWSPTTYNGKQKPTGWTAPADVVNKMSCLFSYTSGKEVTPETSDFTHGSKSVKLISAYEIQSTLWMPGLITTGNFNSSGTCLSSRVSSVTGGIDFRNTPDSVFLDYKLTQSEGTDNMRFVYQAWENGADFSGGANSVEIVYIDSVESNDWSTIAQPIVYNANALPQRLNIIINASKTENAKDTWGVGGVYFAADLATMYVDNLRITYNSLLNGMNVDGVAVDNFSPYTYNYSVDLPADYLGLPTIDMFGAVADQEHRVSYGNEVNGVRTATITSLAEDGTSTLYTVTFNRPASSISTLSDIIINGASVMTSGTTFTANVQGSANPDINIVKGSPYQTVTYVMQGDTMVITVTSEAQTSTTYTVVLNRQYSADATLNDITVTGYNISYSSNVHNYTVTLPYATAEVPQINVTKAYDAQHVAIDTKGVGETSTVTVVAEDGTTTNTYSILFAEAAHTVAETLNDIEINASTISGFAPTTYIYTESTRNAWAEEVNYERTDDEANLNVTLTASQFTWNIGNTTYQLNWQRTLSDDATLADITVDGISVNGFAPDTYDYTLTRQGNTVPTFSVTKGESHQAVVITWSNNVATINVTAEDGTTTLEYTVSVNNQTVASSDALLDNILLNGTGINGFNPNTDTYTVTLPEGTTTLPEIIVVKGEDHQTITITNNGVNDTTVITVTAEDGTTTQNYYLFFDVEKSDIATLDDIEINGISLSGFDSNTFTYSYMLPNGTTTLPSIVYTPSHPGEVVNVVSNGIRGTYQIIVTSESGRFTNTYNIVFSVEPSHDANLGDILNNGSSLTGFDPYIYNYTITLPYGTTVLPVMSYVAGEPNQTINMVSAATPNDTTVITVTAEDGVTTAIYYITYVVALSDNALLDMIFINGEALIMQANSYTADSDFDPEDFYYNITLPYGTTTMPTITWRGQVADYTSIDLTFDTIPGTATITVTSQDGMVINDYILFFFIKKSDNAYLADLTIDGVTVPGFAPDSMSYHIVYPIGTDPSTLPDVANIGYVLGEAGQTVTITNQDGAIVVTVVAEDGVSTFSYVITFEILKSDNALLADLLINGVSVEGFEPTRFDYEYLLPFGSSVVPELTYVKGEPSQTVDVMMGFINDYSYVYVTAEDGTEVTYAVYFRVSTDNPGEVPTSDDVAFNYLGNGTWRASTTRNNVEVRVYSATGAILWSSMVPVADPNENIHQPDATGVDFKAAKEGKVYIYAFFYEKRRLLTGKIAY